MAKYRELKAEPHHVLRLGKTGEKLATRVCFNISGYEDYTVALLIQRNGDTLPYEATVTVDGSLAYWVVSITDMANAGEGYAELQFRNGDQIVKSLTYAFNVIDGLGDETTEPDPHESWADKIVNAATSVLNALKDGYIKKIVKSDDGSTITITNQDDESFDFAGGGGSSSITVDSELSTTSTNPVQNAVITSKLNTKANSSTVANKADKSELPFIATYGTTTYDDVKAAYDSGRVIIVRDTTNLLDIPLAKYYTGSRFYFSSDIGGTFYGYTLDITYGWASTSKDVAWKDKQNIADNASGGIDIKINGTTKTVASQEDYSLTKERLSELEKRIKALEDAAGTSPTAVSTEQDGTVLYIITNTNAKAVTSEFADSTLALSIA